MVCNCTWVHCQGKCSLPVRRRGPPAGDVAGADPNPGRRAAAGGAPEGGGRAGGGPAVAAGDPAEGVPHPAAHHADAGDLPAERPAAAPETLLWVLSQV